MSLDAIVGMQARLISANVPDTVGHKDRPAEIEEIPTYLSVEMTSPEGASVVTRSVTAPGVDGRGLPWLKVDANGSPIQLYSWDTAASSWIAVGISSSATWDPASIAVGSSELKAITVTGAVLGDFVIASFSLDLQGLTISAYVQAADTVEVVLANNTAGAVDLASGTVYARVIQNVHA